MENTWQIARRPALVRARQVMSASVYRALRCAGYPDEGIIEFATSLLAALCEEKTQRPTEEPPVHARTGLTNGDALLEVLEFELDRARSMPPGVLGVILVKVEYQGLCTAAERFSDENLIADIVGSRVRWSDSAGRAEEDEFLLVLPGAGARAVASTARDIHRDLSSAPFSGGVRAQVRHASLEPTMQDAAQLLEAARSSSLVTQASPGPRRSTEEILEGPVVLALCGGAAMAAAHIGVIAALEELGTKITGISATSAGALVAAMYASGMDRDAMLDRFVSLRQSPVFAQIREAYAANRVRSRVDRRGLSRTRVGFASIEEVAVTDDSLLRALVQHFVPCDRPIEGMPIRLALCGTDLVAGRTTYISHGSLIGGLMAACAVPGLFPPVRHGSMLLVDGSMAGELPVAAARSIAGGASVIGSYLDGPEATPTSFDSGVAVAARVAAIRQHELVCEQTRACERLLRVPVEDVGWMGFSRCGEAEQIGRQTVLRELGSESVRRVAGA
ncbi:MAG: patatin-like phospholipase family protein [Myxococcota bacterium]